MSHLYLPLVIAPATLSYQTDWASVETTTPGVSFRKDEALASYALYDNVTFTATSVTFSKPHSEVFESGVVPFLIVGDGQPINIKIAKGRDRNYMEDYCGSASVKFGNNSYHNSESDEKRFYDCPLPLTMSFIPRNLEAQPLQLIVNLTNNVYNSGGPPISSGSGTTVKLTLLNYISEEGYLTAEEDSVCDMILAERSPCVTRGKAISAPSEVEKTLAGETEVERKTVGNAGVYQSDAEGPMNVRGAVGYILPGGNSILVIYFDAVKCRLLVVDAGTAIDSKVVDAAAAKDESCVSGAIVLNGRGSNFRAKALSEIMPGNLVEMEVRVNNVLTR
ncbi:hypothetical protein B0H14DRAFT_3422108 [Mycena olivaceomarginata]|nr:hypothetical protein B0H14DRAFT_3422108 [Mycena olivaceomarginata]